MRRLVQPGDDIVIDGFPRSANTFATHAFIRANPLAVVGNHCHCVAQFKLAAEYDIPAVLVLRHPVDASVSTAIYSLDIDPLRALTRWLTFHRLVEKYQEHFLVAPFDVITTRFSRIVDTVNGRWNTSFAAGDDDSAAVFAAIQSHQDAIDISRGFSRPERLPAPKQSRNEARKRLALQLTEPDGLALSREAQHLYGQLRSLAQGTAPDKV